MKSTINHALFWFLFFVPSLLFAQQTDSITIIAKKWDTIPIKPGVIWKKGHFTNLFQSQQEINFVEIDFKECGCKLAIAADSIKLKKTSQFAFENQAIVAINGGFFDINNGGGVDFIKVNGATINKTRIKKPRANAMLTITKQFISIVPAETIYFNDKNIPNVLLSGPLLIEKGKSIELDKNSFNDNRHPRSSVALTEENRLLLLVVDGRNRLAEGMRLHELTKVLRWLGASNAMNLDGGGSSSLYIQAATKTGIVNHPSDNKKFDHDGERHVANILYLKQ